MRALLIPVALTSCAAMAAPTVDLDRPGALEQIQQQDPALYERVMGVLKAAEVEPCVHLPKIIQAQYRGELASCAAYQILTSFPPKIRVSFVLDKTVYVSNVQQPKLVGSLEPAVEQGKPAK